MVSSEVLQGSRAGLQGLFSLAGPQQRQVTLHGLGVEEPACSFRVLLLHHRVVKVTLQEFKKKCFFLGDGKYTTEVGVHVIAVCNDTFFFIDHSILYVVIVYPSLSALPGFDLTHMPVSPPAPGPCCSVG